MYRCVDCGHIFDVGEEKVYTESHGEKFQCCPVCGGDFQEADNCDDCRRVKWLDELYSGLCIKCLKKSVNGANISAYIKHSEQAEEFYVKWFYETECIQISNELIELCRTGYLQKVALELMSGKQNAVREFWKWLDNTQQIEDYAKWLAQRDFEKRCKR